MSFTYDQAIEELLRLSNPTVNRPGFRGGHLV